jgi:ComF family protein
MSMIDRIACALALAGWPLDVLVPPSCAGCGLPGDPLCSGCRAGLVLLAEPLCARCGHTSPVSVDSCPECPPVLDVARQAVAYEPPAPAIVAALKDRRRRIVATAISEVMAGVLAPPPPGAALVPVPLSRSRRAERGFNQSLLIAHALGSRWDTPVLDVLERVREARPQRGAGTTDRARQVSGAFRARPGGLVPARAWLVDDVHTTGATLAACARALRHAGAQEVGAVAFARVVRA